MNTICLPSGENAGWNPSGDPALVPVTFRGFVPSAFMIQISRSRDTELWETNAICDPSGDQAGCSSPSGLVVNRVRLEPSRPMTQISALPDALDTKAIRDPSGDQAGWLPSTGFELVFVVSDRRLRPSRLAIQILVLQVPDAPGPSLARAISRPSAAYVGLRPSSAPC